MHFLQLIGEQLRNKSNISLNKDLYKKKKKKKACLQYSVQPVKNIKYLKLKKQTKKKNKEIKL